MDQVFSLLQYKFFLNAFFAALLTSISCGIVGTYIVSRRIVFISGGITHSSFGGVGIGYFLGIHPIIGAAIVAVLSALGVEFFSRKANLRNDSIIAMFWAFGMALGIIFIYLTPGYAPNLMSYLFGSILTVSGNELLFMIIITAIVAIFYIIFYRTIVFISFDEEFSATQRVPVQFFNYFLLTLVALTVVINIKVVGIILVLSLLTVPQNVANLFSKKFSAIIFMSILFGFVGSMVGLISAYFFNIPSGASIVFTLILIFFLAGLVKKIILRQNNKT